MSARIQVLALVLFCGGSCTAPAAAAPAASDIPAGIRYQPASPEKFEEAGRQLQSALASGPEALANLFGPHDTRTNATLVGPFLGIHIEALQLNAARVLGRFTYTMPPTALGSELQVLSFHADSPARRRLLAQLVALMARSLQPGKVRAANFDELAMTWAWISWDIAGPLLVYETDAERLLFDFDADTGLITWVERLSDTCVSGSQEGKEVMPCHCLTIERQKADWKLGLDPKPDCENAVKSTITDKLAAASIVMEDPGADPHIAYIRIGARTARVDELLISAYQPDYAIFRLPENHPQFEGVGKLISGAPPERPRDESGKPIHGYVLVGSIVNAAGQLVSNRALLYTDPRLAAAAIKSANEMRVEPAHMQKRPVAEALWQQFDF